MTKEEMEEERDKKKQEEEEADAIGGTVDKWLYTFFKRGEVAVRNTPEDCWVIIRGIVRDVTPVVQKYIKSRTVLPLLAEAGKDISHWFDNKGEFLTFVHPVSMESVPYLPHGTVPQLCDNHMPSPFWHPTPLVPWWRDRRYFIGKLTANERPIRVRNMLTKLEARFTVCEEDTISGGITARYKAYNSAYNSYAWKFEGRLVDMDKTLTENGITDLRPAMREVQVPECLYIPCLDLYYKDDFL